jgi:ribose 5-phosphate isomerase B
MDYISETEIKNIVDSVLKKYSIEQDAVVTNSTQTELKNDQKVIVAIGADHGGFEMKKSLIPYLQEMSLSVIDCGTDSKESVDYPDFAFKVAELVGNKKACYGIMIDGAGIGSSMVANKVPGVRSALCYDYATASNSREHNNANYLTLGAGLIGLNQAKLIVKTFLTTDFGGGRHQRRVDKIMAVEQRFLKKG